MQIKSFYRNPDGVLERDLSTERLAKVRDSGAGLIWLDILDPDYTSADFLTGEMGFHPLAVDDATTASHQPAKVDDYGNHVFLIVHGIDYASSENFVETARLSVFISEHAVVTLHKVPFISIDSVIQRIERNNSVMDRSPGLFAYSLLDSVHDAILPTLDHIGEVAAELEEAAIESPGTELLKHILQLKRSTIRIQRTTAPQVQVFNRLSRHEFPMIEEQAGVYFRDLLDQVIQLEVINQGIRDTADNALATYLSSVGIRQNETMRVLAIVAAVFLPLSLLAGIYGMNFPNIPELEWRWGYFAVLGVMLSVGLTTFYWLFVRRLNWNIRRSRTLISGIKPSVEHVRRVMSPVTGVIDTADATAQKITGTVTRGVRGTIRTDKGENE